jgi:hypothetical protein
LQQQQAFQGPKQQQVQHHKQARLQLQSEQPLVLLLQGRMTCCLLSCCLLLR